MLILSRREAECVCLGDDVVLTIVSVGTDKVRIGVRAPSGVRILRRELEVSQEPALFTGNADEASHPRLVLPSAPEPSDGKLSEPSQASPLILPGPTSILPASAAGPLSQHLRRAAGRRAA